MKLTTIGLILGAVSAAAWLAYLANAAVRGSESKAATFNLDNLLGDLEDAPVADEAPATTDDAAERLQITSSSQLKVGDVVEVTSSYDTFNAEISSIEKDGSWIGWIGTTSGFGYSASYIDEQLASGRVTLKLLPAEDARSLKGDI